MGKLHENINKSKKGIMIAWSSNQDSDDRRSAPTLIKPDQQVKLTIFSQLRALHAKNAIFSKKN